MLTPKSIQTDYILPLHNY